MSFFQRNSTKVWLIITAFAMMSATTVFGQEGPGGIGAFSSWEHQGEHAALVNNYNSIDLLEFSSHTYANELALKESSVLFFVLQAKSEMASSELFLQLGDISIYGNRITFGRTTAPLELKPGSPQIVTLELQRPRRVGLAANTTIAVGDTSIFSLAELVVYKGGLSREERRRVNTYLALKYSVPITKNQDNQWRNYLSNDQGTYWNTTHDLIYGTNVIALGRSDAQDLYQTQTRTTAEEGLMLALEGFAPWGEMPTVNVGNESFIIFSQRDDLSTSNVLCDQEQGNPLYNWKFQLQGWNSTAQHIAVRVHVAGEIEKLSEVYLTDGAYSVLLPLQGYSGDYALYSIPTQKLQQERHYFFTSEKELNTCERIAVECQEGIITIKGDLLTEGWSVTLSSLSGDHSELFSLDTQLLKIVCPAGQQLLSLKDSAGVVQTVVAIDGSWCADQKSSTGTPLIRATLFPNPVGSGRNATLVVEGFVEGQPVEISVMNAVGSIISSEVIPGSAYMEHPISIEVAGVYIVRATQGDQTVSLRLIVE
jgi:hypothetical protein